MVLNIIEGQIKALAVGLAMWGTIGGKLILQKKQKLD